MTEQNIYDIIKMRMVVYKAGVKAGFWEGVDQSGASEMMNYIFPKSGSIAYYNLVMELMRKAHGMFLGGVFYLFKLPAQVERMIMDYLKKEKMDVASLGDDADAYPAARHLSTGFLPRKTAPWITGCIIQSSARTPCRSLSSVCVNSRNSCALV